MVTNKHFPKVIVVVMALSVILCFLAVGYSDKLTEVMGGTGISMEYETKLFNTDEIIDIEIIMDEDQWNEMLSNALSEVYYTCDVVVNGETFRSVAIRPKGNTSLSSIAMDPETDRYSFKLEFNHFVKGQTCYGLDKLILNNNYADATNMKEAIIYDMFQYIGADASLYNYAKISVNGEYWGVYLALEAVEDSFLLRNYGTQDGELYKPESMGIGGGNDDKKSDKSNGFGDFGKKSDDSATDSATDSADENADDKNENDSNKGDRNKGDKNKDDNAGGNSNFNPGEMFGGEDFDFGNMPGGGFSMGSGGSNLNYTDDELDSYSTIWQSEVTKTSKGDHRRVVTALKNISEGTDIETYMDVDNLLKYMAVHTFAVNDDSLSGSMAHNYYLYEYEGQLNIFPWDYNLSLGGMGMGGSDATSMVNDAIDTPFSATKFFNALLENEEYLNRYHEYLQQLVDEYVNSGKFEETYNRIRNQIDELVATDPTAFYTEEEYQMATELLYKTVMLRAESIDGQLAGTIPSTDAEQRTNTDSFVDASDIDVKLMGQMNMGGSGGFREFRPERFNKKSDETGDETSDNTSSIHDNGEFDSSNMPNMEDFDPSNMTGNGDFDPSNMPSRGGFDPSNMPNMEDFDPSNMPGNGDFDPSNMPNNGDFDSSNMPGKGNDNESGKENDRANNGTIDDSGNASEKDSQNESDDKSDSRPSFGGMPGQNSGSEQLKNLAIYGGCLGIMLVAMIPVLIFKRRR